MEVKAKPHLHQDWINSHAFGIVKALQKNGFTTYLVGGCVRDLLLGIHPKDFDIATAAVPQQVKRLIYMSFVIGKRFRLVLVKRDDQQFEVATFRREVKPEDIVDASSPSGDNVFGSPEEDAQRRDFTINGLFYDPINEQLIDYVSGLPDIEARILRMIGDPGVRLSEDPIRILRGLRLAHKLGFTIEPGLRSAMSTHASDLEKSVLPRRREEILKILRLDSPELALLECFDLGILKYVLPTLEDFMQDPERRELFLAAFQSYPDLVDNPADPVQLFAWLVYSFLQAALQFQADKVDVESAEQNRLTIESEVFVSLMQNELGMFKFEQQLLINAIELLPSLQKTEDFRRRGERRQLSLMKNEGFKLAYRLAAADYQLSASQLNFWRNCYEKQAAEINSLEGEAKAKRRRRPRRKRPGEAGGVAADSTDNESDNETENELVTGPSIEGRSQTEST